MTVDDSTAEKAWEEYSRAYGVAGRAPRRDFMAAWHARDAEVAELQAELHFERTGECPSCRGTGVIDSAEHKCGACGGRGYMVPAEERVLREQLAEANQALSIASANLVRETLNAERNRAALAEAQSTIEKVRDWRKWAGREYRVQASQRGTVTGNRLDDILSAPPSTGGNDRG